MFSVIRPNKCTMYSKSIAYLSEVIPTFRIEFIRSLPSVLHVSVPKLSFHLQLIKKCYEKKVIDMAILIPIFHSLKNDQLFITFAWFYEQLLTESPDDFYRLHNELIRTNNSGSIYRKKYPQLFKLPIDSIEEDPICHAIYKDDDAALFDIIHQPNFSKDKELTPLLFHPVFHEAQSVNALQLAAIYASSKCFKLLFTSFKWDMSNISYFVQISGNTEILKLSRIPCRSCSVSVFMHHNSMAEWIIQQFPEAKRDSNAFRAAARGCNIRALSFFEEIDPNVVVDKRSALHDAAYEGHVVMLSCLISKFPRIDLDLRNTVNQTPLHMAIKGHQEKFVEALLRFDCIDINRKCKMGRTALHLAVLAGMHKIVSLLLAMPSINVNELDDRGQTALHYAACCSDEDMIMLLLNDPRVDIMSIDLKGDNALNCAVINQNEEAVRALLTIHDYLVDENTRNPPFIEAINIQNDEIVQLFLDQIYLDINQTDDQNNTPLHCAIMKKANHYIEAFLEFENIDVNRQNALGNTPLHMAIITRNQAAVKMLIEHPVLDITIRNHANQSPLDIARDYHNQAIVELLESYEVQKWQ